MFCGLIRIVHMLFLISYLITDIYVCNVVCNVLCVRCLLLDTLISLWIINDTLYYSTSPRSEVCF